LILTTIN